MKLIKLVFLLAIIGLFIFKAINLLDPDFGWHLKMGELILQKGIPSTDPFSYTMPSYKFVDHEWLADVLIAKLFPIIGIAGLAIFFSILGFFSLFIQIKGIKESFFFLFLPAFIIFLPFMGVRVQIISWLFFSIIITLIFYKHLWKKFYWIIPLLFLLWVNLHGGFVMGLGALLLTTIALLIQAIKLSIHILKLDLIQNSPIRQAQGKIQNFNLKFKINKKEKLLTLNFNFALCTLRLASSTVFTKELVKEIKLYLSIIFLSLAATLINPYGLGLWREVWVSVSDNSLRFSIGEWFPAFFTFNLILWFYFTFSLALFLKFRDKFSFFEKAIYFSFLIAGLLSIRNMPFWIIVSIHLTIKSLDFLFKTVSKYKYGEKRLKTACKFFSALTLVFIFFEVGLYLVSLSNNNQKLFYPEKGLAFLNANSIKGEIFSEYGWGGYLIWKLPSKKVFIDGRMPSWKQELGNNKESPYVFDEYSNLLDGKIELEKIVKKYKIGTFLIPVKKKEKNVFINMLTGIGEKLVNREKKDIYSQLKEDGWEEIYKDDVAVIYEK